MNKKCFIKWLLVIAALAMAVAACTKKQEDESQSGSEKSVKSKPIIKLAQRSWLGSQLNNEVARILLEEEMDYRVEIINVDGTTQFTSLEKGETHVNLEIWPSVRTTEIRNYIHKKKTVEQGGSLGVVGKIGWYIPAYLAAQHPELLTWVGFIDPAKTALFRTPVTGEKGRFLSAPVGWGTHDTDIIKNLGLNFRVIFAGSEESLIAEVEEAYTRQAPILFYFWTPHYLFAKLDLVEVKLPEYSEACYAKRATGGIDCDYPLEILFKAICPGLKDHAPEVYRFFKNFKYSSNDQITMLAQVEVHGKTIEETARFWIMMNKDVWSRWIPKSMP